MVSCTRENPPPGLPCPDIGEGGGGSELSDPGRQLVSGTPLYLYLCLYLHQIRKNLLGKTNCDGMTEKTQGKGCKM